MNTVIFMTNTGMFNVRKVILVTHKVIFRENTLIEVGCGPRASQGFVSPPPLTAAVWRVSRNSDEGQSGCRDHYGKTRGQVYRLWNYNWQIVGKHSQTVMVQRSNWQDNGHQKFQIVKIYLSSCGITIPGTGITMARQVGQVYWGWNYNCQIVWKHSQTVTAQRSNWQDNGHWDCQIVKL